MLSFVFFMLEFTLFTIFVSESCLVQHLCKCLFSAKYDILSVTYLSCFVTLLSFCFYFNIEFLKNLTEEESLLLLFK